VTRARWPVSPRSTRHNSVSAGKFFAIAVSGTIQITQLPRRLIQLKYSGLSHSDMGKFGGFQSAGELLGKINEQPLREE
jgi:hypothetical protein